MSVSSSSILSTDRLAKYASSAKKGEWIRIYGPASLSNLGPGFDAIGLCLDGYGDYVEARLLDSPGVRIAEISGGNGKIPLEPELNTCSVAAARVLADAKSPFGIEIKIEKHVPFGSGIGGSAASAVAGAWAANVLLGEPFLKPQLVHAVLDGEAVASGSQHGDNVLPALLGGLVLVSTSNPSEFRKIGLGRPLTLAVIVPDVEVLTREAREILPRNVALRDAVHNAAQLAFMLDAFRTGDWETVGKCIMSDRLVEPVRAALVPCYHPVKEAALESGALGCALTGSGPAMFAITDGEKTAQAVVDAMLQAAEDSGLGAIGRVVHANPDGTRRI